MANTKFDNKVIKHLKNILIECLDYANNCSLVSDVYIYISFEWVVFLDVFYKINETLYQRHKLNDILKNVDVSISKQKILIDYSHNELKRIRQLFIDDKREVPTQIKLTYSTTGKFETKFSYEKYHNDELFIGDDAVANEWFEELKKD